jgi:CBS domain-containing protein
MHAKDVMSREVHSLPADTSVFDAARMLLARGISAAPVLAADGSLAGILSESDLMRRAETGTEPKRSCLARLLADDIEVAADYIRSHARKIGDLMTRKVVTASEAATLSEIAGLMDRHNVKRIPITRDGKVVGIVSRADLLRGLIACEPKASPSTVPDEQIRAAALAEFDRHRWPSIWTRSVIVENGIVHLWGTAESDSAKQASRVALENIPGVKRIENHIAVLPKLAMGI